jgi:hypothetical protein
MLPHIRSMLLNQAADPDALKWMSAVGAAGASVSQTQLMNVSRLIKNLKASGVWSALDRLWLFAAENATQALTDLVARSNATLVNSPTFTVLQGYTGDGLTTYINSNFAPSGAGEKFSQNAASLGVWVVTAPTTTGGIECGSQAGAPYSVIGARFTSTDYIYGLNSISFAEPAHNNLWTGAFHVQRTGASSLVFSRNGAQVDAGTGSSTTVNTGTFSFLCQATGGSHSTAQVGAGWIGASSGASEVYGPLRTYMTAVGVS